MLQKSLNGSVGPVDNITSLNQHNGQSSQRQDQSSQVVPAPKRQRLNQQGRYHESNSMSFSDQQPVTPDVWPKRDLSGSRSATSNTESALLDLGVPEYRNVHAYTDGAQPRNRHRKPRGNFHAHSPGDRHPSYRPNGTSKISAAHGREMFPSPDHNKPYTKRLSAGSNYASHQTTKDSADTEITRPPKRQARQSQVVSTTSPFLRPPNGKIRVAMEDIDEPDELSSSIHKPPGTSAQLKEADTGRQASRSTSISRRADLKPSNLMKRRSNPLYRDGLLLRGAARECKFLYAAANTFTPDIPNSPRLLRQVCEAGTKPILACRDTDGNEDIVLQPWLRINSGTLQRVEYSPTSAFVRIFQPNDTSIGAGRVLVLEFHSSVDAAYCVDWCFVQMNHTRDNIMEIPEYEFPLASVVGVDHSNKFADLD